MEQIKPVVIRKGEFDFEVNPNLRHNLEIFDKQKTCAMSKNDFFKSRKVPKKQCFRLKSSEENIDWFNLGKNEFQTATI